MDHASSSETGIFEAPAELGTCHLGSGLVSVSKERQPSGWVVWGNYGCCGMILLDCLQEEPTAVVVAGKRFHAAG